MNDSKIHRSMILFEESIHSKYTKRNYISQLNHLKKFIGLKITDELINIPQDNLQKLLEDYLINLKYNVNPNSLPSKFQGIKHYCTMNRININWNIIYKMFPQKQKTQTLRAYTTQEIDEMLSHVNDYRNRALIHFFASTGARIGVFDNELLICHMRKMTNCCTAIKLYAETIEEYWSFLTPQASKILNEYHIYRERCGEIFHDSTPIFSTKNNKSTQLSWNGTRSTIYRIITHSNIHRIKQKNRYDVQIDHGFRKRFNTILKLDNNVNYNIAEKLLGHKNGLDGVYFTPTLDELFVEFVKIMHKLEIKT